GQVRDRLDVVDDGRLAVQADGGGEVGRLEPGLAPAALQRVDEGGLLATDVGTGAEMDGDVEAVAGAEDVVAEDPGGVRLVDRRLEPTGGLGVLTPDVDEGVVHFVRPR